MVLLAVIQVITGIQLLVSSLIYFALVSWVKTPEGLEALTKAGDWAVESAGGVFFLLGALFLVLGVVDLLLARGYVQGREWARHRGRVLAVTAIVFAVLGGIFLPSRVDPGSPVWTVIFNLIVVLYLGRAKVRRYFSK